MALRTDCFDNSGGWPNRGDGFVIYGATVRTSWLASFSRLGELPLDTWTAHDAGVLERAMLERKVAPPGDGLRNTVDIALAELRRRCSAAPTLACRFALGLLRETHSYPPKYFAFTVLEGLLLAQAQLPETQRQELIDWLKGAPSLVDNASTAAEERCWVQRVYKLWSLAPELRAQSRMLLEKHRIETERGMRRPTRPTSMPALLRGDGARKEGRCPQAWWRAREVAKVPGTPIFRGSSVDVRDPPTRFYKDWYQRCHPSTY